MFYLNDSFFNSLFRETCTVAIVNQLNLLYHELKTVTQVKGAPNGKSSSDYSSLSLGRGVAVAPDIAAWCFQDYLRTYRFMRAVYLGTQKKIGQHPHRKVKILYAGCGPYCPLILPLLYLFDATEVELTLLEINPHSFQVGQQLITTLGKNQFIKEMVCEDATQYIPQERNGFDIILSETMDKALEIEPQVAIFLNLYPYLKKDGILIPEQITVDLYATDIRKEKSPANEFYLDTVTCKNNKKQRTFVKNIMTVDQSFLELNLTSQNEESYYLTSVNLSKLKTENIDFLYLTNLKIFDSITLQEDESFLTLKVYAFTLTPEIQHRQVEFSYRMNSDPRIVKKIV